MCVNILAQRKYIEVMYIVILLNLTSDDIETGFLLANAMTSLGMGRTT